MRRRMRWWEIVGLVAAFVTIGWAAVALRVHLIKQRAISASHVDEGNRGQVGAPARPDRGSLRASVQGRQQEISGGALEQTALPDAPKHKMHVREGSPIATAGPSSVADSKGTEKESEPSTQVAPLDRAVEVLAGQWGYGNETISIGGEIYEGYGRPMDFATFDIRGWDRFVGFVGVNDNYRDGAASLSIEVDGEPNGTVRVGSRYKASTLDVALRGKETLTLRADGPLIVAEPALVRGDGAFERLVPRRTEQESQLRRGEIPLDRSVKVLAGQWGYGNETISIGGEIYEGYGRPMDFATFDIRSWDCFVGFVGVNDNYRDRAASLSIEIDGQTEKTVQVGSGSKATRVEVPLTGKETLTMRSDGSLVVARPKLVGKKH